MAFTDAQKAQIRMYLGHGDRFLQVDSALERAFGAVTSDVETLIVAELAKCVAIDTDLIAARKRFKVDRAGDVFLSSGRGDEMHLLCSSGRIAVGRIAALLRVEVRTDVFSGAGRGAGSEDNLLPLG